MKLRLYKIAPFLLQATLWRIVMRPFFTFFTRFEVHGLENLKGLPPGVIFAPNHSSELDSVLLPLALPVWSRFSPVYYVVREPRFYKDPFFGLRKYLYAGWIFKALGAFPITSGVRNYAESLKSHVQILKDGGAVCIFPEGSLTKNGEIGHAHGGVGYMAFAANAQVIPVLVSGTRDINLTRLFLRNHKISLNFLPAQSFPAFAQLPSGDDYKLFAARVLDLIKQEHMIFLGNDSKTKSHLLTSSQNNVF